MAFELSGLSGVKTKGTSTLSTSPRIGTRGKTEIEELAEFARSRGLEKEAEEALEKPKLGFFQRLSRGLTAFETGNALYKARYEAASFPTEYFKDIGIELGSAVTGKDLRTQMGFTPKKTFKDIMVKEGFKDRPGKLDAVDVLGLTFDIVFDPLTFFGGAAGKAAFRGGRALLKGLEKAPVIGQAVGTTRTAYQNLFTPFAKQLRLRKVTLPNGTVIEDAGPQYVDGFTKYA